MSHIDIDNPEFTTAIRGYDKLQVDDYLERLQSYAAEAEERARAAEAEVNGDSHHSTVGPRVSEIFELAADEAKEVRRQAAAEAEKIRSDARRKADEIVERAERDEDAIRERSEQEAQDARSAIETERRRSELALAQLQDTKAALLSDLRQIHRTLAQAAGLSEEETEIEHPAFEDVLEEEETREHRPVPRSNAA